jgi:hypothetical protein
MFEFEFRSITSQQPNELSELLAFNYKQVVDAGLPCPQAGLTGRKLHLRATSFKQYYTGE